MQGFFKEGKGCLTLSKLLIVGDIKKKKTLKRLAELNTHITLYLFQPIFQKIELEKVRRGEKEKLSSRFSTLEWDRLITNSEYTKEAHTHLE